MRIPLAANLESRNGSLTKDAKVKNALIEKKGDVSFVVKRPGLTDLGLVKAGVAQLLTYWNGIRTVQDDYMNGGDAVTYATFNSSDKGDDVTLSGGDLTVAIAGSGSDAVRSTISKSSGKWYWEVTVNNTGTNRIGVANATHSVDVGSGSPNSSLGLSVHSLAVGADGNIFDPGGGGATIGSIGAYTSGDVIGVALDCDNDTVSFRKNGSSFVTISGSDVPTGALFAAVGQYAGSTDNMTVNFGALGFAFPVPAGYNSGLYTETASFGSSTALNPSEADLMFSAQDNGKNAPTPYLMFKNARQGWTVNASGTVAQITDVDYPGTYSVTLSSLTRSSTTATATTPTDTNFQVGSAVTIAGANESAYNGTKIVTAVTPSTSVASDPIQITITRSTTTATATCINALHNYTTGQQVLIEGADQEEYNGLKTITVTSPTAFTFTVTVTGTELSSPATGTPTYFINAANAQVALTISGGTATVTWASHGLQSGASVRLHYVVSNVVKQIVLTDITVSDDNTFTGATGESAVTAISANAVQVASATISSITASGTTATVTTSSAHHLGPYRSLIISGASPAYYNVTSIPVNVTSSTTFTYSLEEALIASPVTPATGNITSSRNTVTAATFTFTVAGSPTTPATGTITATGGRNTVPGIVYLNGRFYVMDINGVIYGSEEDAPATWNALEYLIAQNETGAGKAIAKSLSYLVAFKEWSTEFFYDAGNPPPGTPLAPVDNGFTQVGCASGDSVADVAGNLCWIAQEKKVRGRSVYLMAGTAQQKISTPDIDRILGESDLSSVHAYGLKIAGHTLYVLTLVDQNVTLAYSIEAQAWVELSSLTAGTPASISSITRSDTTVTVTFGSAHGLSDGDPLYIAGADQSDYNGVKQVTYVSSTVVTFQTSAAPATPATGTITGTASAESYFKFTKYANCNGRDLVLHESDGHLYEILPSVYQDDGTPINAFIRTARLDGGTSDRKKNSRITLVGDKVSDSVAIRWSDDDMGSSSTYRPVDMSKEEPNIRRCGAFKRRTYELRHVGNNPLRLEAMDLEIE